MADRITNAVESLIVHLVPNNPRESEDVVNARYERCFQIAKNILERRQNASVTDDANHAYDIIKHDLMKRNPKDALDFSNLYSRLLALPVLKNKWAILHLLSQLSDSNAVEEPVPVSSMTASTLNYRDSVQQGIPKRPRKENSGASAQSSRLEQEQFRDAFQPDGLKSFPPQENKQHNTPPKRDVGLKSTLLAGNYSEINPSETALLRDLPYTLQGLSSTTLPFSGENTIKLPNTLPLPLISILHTLAEPSLLYRGLDQFCSKPANGLLGQSLRSGIAGELRSYLTLVATLEGQIRRALASLNEEAPRGGIGKAGVTLKRCVVWTREATMGLRMMSLIAEESKERRGGQIISHIHSFSATHGDPVVAAFAERLLATCTRPFYDILRRWIYDGELSDPYQEFFVRERSADQAPSHHGTSNAWEDKYEICDDMIPSIITEDFAQKVFLIGKSLNFIRHSCGDSLWVEEYSKAASKELTYGDTATLEGWIDEAYKTTMKRLMDLMDSKFHVFDHLQALKNYILLGQGDFIALLMESLAANLDRPAGAQYRHTLTAQLEHAIRGSIAQYDSPEVLRRLDARMLQLSHGDIGWDCFTLEYKIDAPVDVVVTEWGNRQYLKVFNFLWRIKRVEFGLLSTWRKCMTGSRGVLQTSDAVISQTWKSTRGVLAEMIHFVGQLQYYILFEVIESSWGELQNRIRKEDCTLDDMIKAHERYLNDITHKGLLGAKRKATSSGDEEERAGYLVQLSDLLKLMLSYRDAIGGLYSWSVSEFTRQQQTGEGGFDDSNVSSEFPVLQERLRHLGASFKQRLQLLLGDLAFQPDVDMRFLGVAMNFNEVYQPTRRKSRHAGSTQQQSKSQQQQQQQQQQQHGTANSSFNMSRA